MLVYLLLHNIRSLHNVGSIFRTADGMGVKKIYLTGYTPSPYDFFGPPAGGLRKNFQKTALGAEKYVEWERAKNIHALLKKLKKEKIFVTALEQSKQSILLNSSLSNRIAKLLGNRRQSRPKLGIALILGNEVRGLPKSVLRISDAVFEIPMRGKKESLNVSVAAGIALYAIRFTLSC